MSDHKGANRARIILEAVRLASSAEVPSLQLLIAREPNILQLELVLRILLTYLPESTEPKAYIDLLHQIACGAVHPPPQSSLRPVQHGKELSDNEVRYQVRRLHLLPLAEERDLQAGCTDLLSLFLIHRARKIDVETGSIPGVQELLEPFSNRDPYLRVWTVSNILPLRRLNYEYYPDVEDPYTLEALEHLEGRPAIDSLLARSARLGGTETIQCARDIRGVVGPWIYGESSPKRRKTHHDRRRTSFVSPTPAGQVESVEAEDFYTAWLDVHDWIVDLALRNFAAAAETLEQWDGPTDVDYDGYNDHEDLELDGWQTQTLRYAQAGLAIAYANSETTPSAFDKTSAVLRKVSQLSGLDAPPALDEIQTSNVLYVSKEYLDQLSEVHLLHNALLRPDNPVTSSTQASLSFASLVLRSCVLLQKLGNSKSCRVAAALAAFARPEEQMNELHKTLQKVPVKTRDDSAWAAVRQQILWLRDWQFQASGMGHGDGKESMGIFGKVKQMDAEVEILRALLRASCYDLAVHVYCMQDERPISKDALERTVLSVAMSFYDGASNGNRTRGGIRKASEMLAAFQSHFPQSQHFDQANALLAATHSISFYSLTLQHGVPFQPVNIRASKDPMSLIGKILEQNARSYTKLDDLIEIGRNLVGAKLGSARDPSSLTPGAATTDSSDDQEQKLHESSRRITSMAIEAALTEGDFDTAYSYIVNRLSPALPTQDPTPAPITTTDNNNNNNNDDNDDISWRAAYLAGRSSSPSPPSLRRLEQRLELLSLSLLLAPPPHLAEILHVWRAAENDLTALLARETAEDDRWNRKADHRSTNIIPGGFVPSLAETDRLANHDARAKRQSSAAKAGGGGGGNNNEDAAPMGLFDVARGAAKAFQKSAFPLRATAPASASGGGGGGAEKRPISMAGSEETAAAAAASERERVRKRDVVANAVTGGLASGIGWVIGAPGGGGGGGKG